MPDGILPAIRRLAGDGPTPDAELLRRWRLGRDEAAFELLVWRHAALVLGTCRGVLRDAHAAEDAFQATFLVLVRKADTIASGDSLPAWLHRVALRACSRARTRPTSPLTEEPAVTDPAPDPDLGRVLHEEVERLPAKYRLPVVLCLLEGRTHAQAASELGWPVGTVAGRLSRAREMLRRRLLRRGVGGSLPASVAVGWPALAEALLGAARSAAFRPPVVALARGVMREMFWTKMRWSSLALLAGCLFGLAALVSAGAGEEKPAAPKAAQAKAEPKEEEADPLREAMDRARVRKQMMELGKALRQYSFNHGHYLPPALVDTDGKPRLSWRVALLPYLNEGKLYGQFRCDEDWDGPNNKKLLDKMPAIFSPVGKGVKPGTTYFQYVVGPTAAFPAVAMRAAESRPFNFGGSKVGRPSLLPGAGVPSRDEALKSLPEAPSGSAFFSGDGAENTILVVEGGDPVEWTKPRDVDYAPDKPLPKLGGQFANVVHVLSATQDVYAIPKRTAEKTWRAAITIAGREPFELRTDAGRPGDAARIAELRRLAARNVELKEEAALLKQVMEELKSEVNGLGWAVERERQAKIDSDAASIANQNADLEASLKESREEARKLLDEVRRLSKELQKKK